MERKVSWLPTSTEENSFNLSQFREARGICQVSIFSTRRPLLPAASGLFCLPPLPDADAVRSVAPVPFLVPEQEREGEFLTRSGEETNAKTHSILRMTFYNFIGLSFRNRYSVFNCCVALLSAIIITDTRGSKAAREWRLSIHLSFACMDVTNSGQHVLPISLGYKI